MPKPSKTLIRVLDAAKRGSLNHSISGDYDWIDLLDEDGGRVTRAAQSAVAGGLIELLPPRRGDEHRGQPYKLTDAGAKVLADNDAEGK